MLTRILTLLTSLFASLVLFHSRDGALQTLLWGPKLFASALSPLLAFLSSLLAVVGFKRRNWFSAGLGLTGAVIATKHVRDVTTSREAGFAEAFGPHWPSKIPNDLRPRLRPYRWRPFYRRRPQGAVHLDVVYGENSDSGRPLVADLLQPPPGVAPTGLAMIFAHGGAWWYGRKNISKFPYFQRLVFQGHVVMDINYTLAPHSSIPGMVKDIKQAILWLKQHAGICEVNPEKVVLTGQSAGAQLCLLAAYAPNHPAFQPAGMEGDASVSGVISYCGPPDMTALYYDIQARLIRYVPNRPVNRIHRLIEILGGHGDSLANGIASVVGGTPDEIPEVYRLISPVTYVSQDCPPTLLLQSTHDLLVDYREVERFYHKLRAVNTPVIYVPFPNCAHTFESILPRISPPAQTAAYYMERFLALLV
jgi:acetyl esterase/lipase